MITQSAPSTPKQTQHPAFAFVQLLAAELSEGTVELPSFPEVAERVRRALDDPASSIEHIAHIVGAEPVLAARLMTIANSAAFTQLGKPLTDLRSAVMRLGCNMVRSAALAFAVAQMKSAPQLKPIAKSLESLWRESTHVAAMCRVLSKRSRINPDEAFLTGLLHGMGKLYVLARAAAQPQLFADAAGLEDIVRGWQASIGKAVLENWNVPERVIEAVAAQDDRERKHYGEADLTDILLCAKIIAESDADPTALAPHLERMDAFRQLHLDPSTCIELLSDATEHIAALRAALGA